MKTYYYFSDNLFEYSTLTVDENDDYDYLKDGWIELTAEQIQSLHNHTLCWDGNKLIPYTKTQKDTIQEIIGTIQLRIFELKQQLSNTDYQAIKYAEGMLTEEEYTSIKAQRQAWRDEINELEKDINQ